MCHCIYCRNDELTRVFDSREHIFPAALGGKTMLPKNIVCNECNTDVFSKLERQFIQNSPIGIIRQSIGPGKRGSLSPKKASASGVCLMLSSEDNADIQLGIMKLGRPYIIPQMRIVGDDLKNILLDVIDQSDYQNIINVFFDKLKKYDNTYSFIHNNMNESEMVHFGIYKNKYYLLAKTEEQIKVVEAVILQLKNNRVDLLDNLKESKSKVEVNQLIYTNVINEGRVIAKIVMNFLCHKFGRDFVLDERFDPIREWICHGVVENRFANWANDTAVEILEKFSSLFSFESHKIFAINTNTGLIAVVSFYGYQFPWCVYLTDIPFDHEIFAGFICDWRNAIEKEYFDFLKETEIQ